MKPFIKIAAMLLAIVLAGSFLTACSKGNDFTCADVVNRSASQQTWLKSPESNLVLNPNAVDAEDKRDMTAIPLSFGVKDANGNIIATYDDAFFILERRSPEVLQQLTFDTVKGLSKVENLSVNTTLSFVIPPNFNKELDVRLDDQKLLVDYTDSNIYLKVNITELPEECYVSWTPTIEENKGLSPVFCDWSVAGSYLINLKQAAENGGITNLKEGGNETSFFLRAFYSGTFTFSEVSLVRIAGYQSAAKAPSTEWAPYYMKATVEYPNNTSIETVDFFYGANSVTRKITPKIGGDIGLAGKIYGTCTYNAKENALTFDNGSTKYVIFPKKKGTVEYYATYEDLLNGVNALESPDGAAYWSILVNGLTPSEDNSSFFYVSVAASDTLSIDELLAEGKDATSTIKVRKVYDGLEAYWNEFIAANDVSEYITVIPE